MALNNSINNTVGGSNTGATNILTVTNSSDTASSSSQILSIVGGGSAGDPYFTAQVNGSGTYSWGVDNSDSDAFVMSLASGVGSNNFMRTNSTGEVNWPLQAAFLAYLASSDSNVTGSGTFATLGAATALTEVFDQNSDFNTNGTFTAPITGRYRYDSAVDITGCTVCTGGTIEILTSNRAYRWAFQRVASANDFGSELSCLADMDAADTSVIRVQSNGEAGDTDDIFGNALLYTFFSGNLVC